MLRDAAGTVVIGKQFEEHNSLPGPVYAGGGYTLLSAAIRGGPPAVRGRTSDPPFRQGRWRFELATRVRARETNSTIVVIITQLKYR